MAKPAPEFADLLRARVRNEIHVTISVGVSFNKTFAKMGSDYKKPDATTVITEANFREILWPLPVSEMLFVGKSASARLNRAGIQTIGDLANAPESRLSELLGKSGLSLRRMCNRVATIRPSVFIDDRPESKSVSHGTTFRRDLTAESEIRSGITMLSGRGCAAIAQGEPEGHGHSDFP